MQGCYLVPATPAEPDWCAQPGPALAPVVVAAVAVGELGGEVQVFQVDRLGLVAGPGRRLVVGARQGGERGAGQVPVVTAEYQTCELSRFIIKPPTENSRSAGHSPLYSELDGGVLHSEHGVLGLVCHLVLQCDLQLGPILPRVAPHCSGKDVAVVCSECVSSQHSDVPLKKRHQIF